MGDCNFYIKTKLKFEIFNDKKVCKEHVQQSKTKTKKNNKKKKCFHVKKFSCNHPIQASFIAVSLLCQFLTSGFMHIQICHANFDNSMVTESCLQHDKSTE